MARNTRMPNDVAELTAAWKRRHDEMERGVKFVGAHDATSTRAPSRQEVREMMSYRGGQGDPDAMLGERMNPILEAPMFAAGVPMTGAAALATAGTVLGASYGLEKLAEENPRAAAVANLALAAAPAVPMAKAGASAFGKAVRGKLSDAIDFGPLAVSGKGEVSAMADRAAKAAALRAMRRARDAQAAVERAHSTRAVDSVMSQLGSLDDMKQAGYDPEFIELLRENGWRRGYIPQNNMPEDEAVRLMIGTQTRGKMLAEAVRKSDGELLPPSFFVTERGAKTGVPLEGWNSSLRDEVGAGHDFRVVLVPKRDVVNPAESQYVKWFVGDGQTPQIGVNGVAPPYESRVVIGDPGNPGELARGLREYQKKLSGHGTPANKANSAGVSPSTPAHFLVPELEGVDISSGFPTAYKANWNLSRKLPNYGSILGSRNPHGALLANMYDYLTGRPDVIRSIELSQMQRALKKGLVDSLAEAVVKQRRFDGWQFGNAIGSVYGYANKADRTMTHNVHSNLKRGLNLGLDSTNYKTGRSTPMWDVSLVSRAQIEAMDEIVDALAGAQTREAAVASVRRLAEGMHLADWQTEGLTRRGGQLWDLMQDTPKGEATLDRFPGQRKLSSISSSGSSSRPYDEVKAAARLYRLGDDTDMALFVMPKGWKDGGETLRPGFMEDFNATTEFLDRKGVPWHVREVLDTDDIFGKRTGEALMELHPGFQDAKGGRTVHAAEGAGDTAGTSETVVSETPVSEAPAQPSGPRIVINPKVFTDKRDALCVAFNEAFRVVMEMNGFEPVSEPTEKQRKFFADTAYADDELQLRRTILARIATLDTSVSDPTDEQLEETMEMLEMVMEVGAPQNEWEQQAVQRLHDVVAKSLESTRANGTARQPEPPKDEASAQADVGGGITDEEWKDGDVRYVEKDGSYYRQTYKQGETSASSGWQGAAIGKDEWDSARRNIEKGVSAQRFAEAWDAGTEDWNNQQKEIRGLMDTNTEAHNEVNRMATEGVITPERAQRVHNFDASDGASGGWTWKDDTTGRFFTFGAGTIRDIYGETDKGKNVVGYHASGDRGVLNQTRTLDLDLNEDELAKKATSSALAGLANMEPDKPAEPQAAGLAGTEPEKAPEATPVPSGTGMAGIPSGTGEKPPETAVAGAPGTSSPNWANGAVVGKDDPEAFGRVEHSWANGQDVAGLKDDPGAFGTEAPGIRGVAMPKPVEPPKLNWQGLASRTDARGRYFDSDGRVITKRQAERMERKKRKELGLA